MSVAKSLKLKSKAFTEDETARLIRMGWEDRTSFEAIEQQFGLTPNEFVRWMRRNLDRKSFDRWRRRVHQQGHLKNEKRTGGVASRFKATRQTVDGITKGWKPQKRRVPK